MMRFVKPVITLRIAALVIPLGATAASEAASDPDAWSCWALGDAQQNVVTSLLGDHEGGAGVIVAAGEVQDADYSVQGLSRRWDFGKTGSGISLYAFVITPAGEGRYYDFTIESPADPAQYFRCARDKAFEELARTVERELSRETDAGSD